MSEIKILEKIAQSKCGNSNNYKKSVTANSSMLTINSTNGFTNNANTHHSFCANKSVER